MPSYLQQALQDERDRRASTDGSKKVKLLMSRLSPIQQEFILDNHRFKVACSGRRAGKSYAIAAYMIRECLMTADTPTLYLGLTRDSAKEAVWYTLLGMLEGLNIPHTARPSGLTIRFPNGSSIILFGGDVPNARNRLRGRKFKLVCADETGFFAELDPIIYALLPTLADLKGTLIMCSSPGEILNGFFYDAYEGATKADWRQWHWSLLDNPHFQRPATNPKFKSSGEEELETIARLQFGGDRRHPAFVREYLGKYVRDDTALVYPYNEKNLIDAPTALPQPLYALGIDLGVSSESAICALKYSLYSREVQIVETFSKKELSVDDLAEHIAYFTEKYSPTVTIADTGGIGAAFVQELRKRYGLAIRAADKIDKAIYQKIFQNDLRSGYIKVLRSLNILSEWDKIVKDDNGQEVKGQKNHEADAALYVYRYIYSTYLKTFEKPLSEEDRMMEDMVSVARQEAAEADELREEAQDYGI